MSQSNDFDTTYDGIDPADIARSTGRRRRRQESEMDDFMPSLSNQPRNRRTSAPAQRPAAAQEPQQPAQQPAAPAPAPAPTPAAKFSFKNLGIVKFFIDWRTHAFVGCLLLLMCVFMFIAAMSHFKSGFKDQSLVENTPLAGLVLSPQNLDENGNLLSSQEIKERDAAAHKKTENAAGPLGAWLAKKFMCNGLGLGSLVFIAYALFLALALFRVRKCNFWSLTFKTLLLAITISIVVGLITYNSETPIRWGGLHGHYVNKVLMDAGTVLLAMLVSILLICAVACVYLNELRLAWQKWTRAARHRRLQEQLRRERERQLQTVEHDEPEPEPQAEVEVSTQVQTQPEPQPAATEPNPQGSEGFSLADISPAEPQPTESAPFSFYEAPDEAPQDFTFFVEEDKEEFQNNEEPEPVTAPAQKEDFSVVTKEIEKADASDAPVAPMGSLQTPYDHCADLSTYKLPDSTLLIERQQTAVVDMEEQQANKDRIVETLAHYNIQISRIEATVGPTITLYEIVPAEGVRISQIKRLEDDIALSLSALGIRIVAPIPGKGTVGIEVPNKDPQIVSMHSVITSKAFQQTQAKLPMAIGATISNEIFIADMANMPHLLVAGATGMGKSVGLNAIIASLLYKKHPSELKFVLVDPKMVEFSLYSKLERHYLAKLPGDDDAVITEPLKVVQTLNSLCLEMDQRYSLLKDAHARTLEEYNKKYSEHKLLPTKGHRYLPYIVVIVDEFADLIMMAGKDVEQPIMRIAQKARAVGIHMIIATQRPATNVITGNIKANFPGRIAFRVIQMVDSRTILDSPGANQLIGKGDMLFSHNGVMKRVQCAFISTKEVEAITDWIDSQVGYPEPYYLPEVPIESAEDGMTNDGPRDSLFEEAARYVVSRQMSSSSSLQRQFNIGYNRAARLMDQMEMAGIVGPANGAKPRNILVDNISLEDLLNTLS